MFEIIVDDGKPHGYMLKSRDGVRRKLREIDRKYADSDFQVDVKVFDGDKDISDEFPYEG